MGQLRGARSSLPAGAIVGFHRDRQRLLDVVEELAAAGFRHVKLKIRPGYDRQPLDML